MFARIFWGDRAMLSIKAILSLCVNPPVDKETQDLGIGSDKASDVNVDGKSSLSVSLITCLHKPFCRMYMTCTLRRCVMIADVARLTVSKEAITAFPSLAKSVFDCIPQQPYQGEYLKPNAKQPIRRWFLASDDGRSSVESFQPPSCPNVRREWEDFGADVESSALSDSSLESLPGRFDLMCGNTPPRLLRQRSTFETKHEDSVLQKVVEKPLIVQQVKKPIRKERVYRGWEDPAELENTELQCRRWYCERDTPRCRAATRIHLDEYPIYLDPCQHGGWVLGDLGKVPGCTTLRADLASYDKYIQKRRKKDRWKANCLLRPFAGLIKVPGDKPKKMKQADKAFIKKCEKEARHREKETVIPAQELQRIGQKQAQASAERRKYWQAKWGNPGASYCTLTGEIIKEEEKRRTFEEDRRARKNSAAKVVRGGSRELENGEEETGKMKYGWLQCEFDHEFCNKENEKCRFRSDLVCRCQEDYDKGNGVYYLTDTDTDDKFFNLDGFL